MDLNRYSGKKDHTHPEHVQAVFNFHIMIIVCGHMCRGTHVEVGGQLLWGSLLPSHLHVGLRDETQVARPLPKAACCDLQLYFTFGCKPSSEQLRHLSNPTLFTII